MILILRPAAQREISWTLGWLVCGGWTATAECKLWRVGDHVGGVVVVFLAVVGGDCGEVLYTGGLIWYTRVLMVGCCCV
jgi:hypothetical protein